MEPVHALERWHEFYILVGTAGATLLGLLFVAVSLGAGFLTEKRAAATRAFFSPVILHFAVVFFVSAVGLVPAHSVTSLAILVGATALIGIGVSFFTTIQLLRHRWTKYVRDHLAYGVLPAVCYVALLAAAGMIVAESEYALDDLAGVLLLLLLVNIRNAWDLTLSMIWHQAKRR